MIMPSGKKFLENSNYVIATGASLMILLMTSLAVVGISRVNSISQDMENISVLSNGRIQNLEIMRQIVRDRTLSMYAISLMSDPFEKDQEYMRFRRMAEPFITNRISFTEKGLHPEQIKPFDETRKLINRTAVLQNEIIEKLMDEDQSNIFNLMSVIDLPLERQILALYDELIKIEQTYTENGLASAKQAQKQIYFIMMFMAVGASLISVIITYLIIKHTSRIENALSQAKEQAEVTLHSIGEAVITSDSEGNVIYLNPVAEALTGWQCKEAIGKPLIEVYKIKSENDNEIIDHPAYSNTTKGQTLYQPQHGILNDRNNNTYIIKDKTSLLSNKHGVAYGKVVVTQDVTQEIELTRRMTWQAKHDSLTKLVNRVEFEQSLNRLITSRRSNDCQHALVYLDLDQFKLVNDTCGHFAGDELLKQLVSLLKSKVREQDLLARLGGDEFGLILTDCSLSQAEIISMELVKTVKEFRFSWDSKIFTLGMSAGLVAIDATSTNFSTLMSAADAACFIAKDQGRNRVWVHHHGNESVQQRQGEMEWTTRINAALEMDRFCFYYQSLLPVNNTIDRHYMELLIRMIDEDGKIIAPMAFIPSAERYGLMPEIDRWVIKNAIEWLHTNADIVPSNQVIAINISGQTICDDGILDFCKQHIKNLPAGVHICFEITETAAVLNWTNARNFVLELKSLGCLFALDDFGSGMSSFSYIKNLPVDYIKIDGDFVIDLLEDPMDLEVVVAINQIGHTIGIKTIAEFVESSEILEKVKQIGIDYAQGNFVATAKPLNTFNNKGNNELDPTFESQIPPFNSLQLK